MKIILHEIYISIFLMLINSSIYSQKQNSKIESGKDDKLLNVGFSFGFNTMNFNIKPSNEYLVIDSLKPKIDKLYPGINIQLITNFTLNEHLDIRFLPGLLFGQRTITFYKNQAIYKNPQIIESTYIDFPLLLRYNFRQNSNTKPYIIGGISFRYDIFAKKELSDEMPLYIRLKWYDLNCEAGAGFNFNLKSLNLSVELKMSNGLGNIIADDRASGHSEFRNAIEKMKSQIWVLSFHFE